MDARTKQQFEQMAERGSERGADRVLEAARAGLTSGSTSSGAPARERRWRAPVWVMAAAAAAALLVIGGTAFFFTGGDPDTAGPAPTTQPDGTVSSTEAVPPEGAAAAAAAAGPVWVVAEGAGEVFGPSRTPADLLAFDGTLVAAGSTEIDVPRAAVWVSADGMSWREVGGDLGPDTRIMGLATDGEVLVAAGTAFDDDPSGFDHAAVWVTADGEAWARVPHDEAVFPKTSRIAAVAWEGRFVAVGTMPETEEVGGVEPLQVGAAWVSDDGIVWQRAGMIPDAFAVHDVAAAGGRFVAVGERPPGSAAGIRTTVAAVWLSEDGVVWTPVEGLPLIDPLDEECVVEGIDHVAAGRLGILASGHCKAVPEGGAPAVVLWTSSTGAAWEFASQPTQEPLATGWVTSVLVNEQGYRAVGARLDGNEFTPASWYSADGVTWAFQTDGSGVQVSTPGARTEEVLRAEESDLTGRAWMGPMADTGERLVSLGIGADGGIVWVSAAR